MRFARAHALVERAPAYGAVMAVATSIMVDTLNWASERSGRTED